MRILHLTTLFRPDGVGGAELFVETLAREQVKAGHQVAVAALSRHQAPAQQEGDGITVYRLGYTAPLFPLDRGKPLRRKLNTVAVRLDPLLVPRVARAIRDFRPDVINTHSLSDLTPLVWTTARRARVPLVHTLHDFTSMCVDGAAYHAGHICDGKPLKCYCLSLPHRLCQHRVDGLVGVGANIIRRHRDAGLFRHVPPERCRVIWNAIETPATPDLSHRPSAPVVFGYLGRLEPSKGADFLLEALHGLPGSGWRLEMAGKAPGGLDRYQALATGLPVTFPGYVDIDDFFARIDCLIVPALWPEAFGRTVAEARLRGVPVIGSAIAGIAEQLQSAAGGNLFTPGDAPALTARLSAFLADPSAFAATSDEIDDLRRATDPASIARRYVDLYNDLLDDRRSPST